MEERWIGDPAACVAPDEEAPDPVELAVTRGTVLIVEDHEPTRTVYAQVLRLFGYGVEEAPSAIVGIERARVMHPDLILMDIGLPEVSGWAAARVLRADEATSDIPLLAFSAAIDSSEALRSMDEGVCFDGFVTKPVLPSELARCIGAVIRDRRQMRSNGAAA